MMKIKARFGDLFNWQKNHRMLLYLALVIIIIAGLIFMSYISMLYIARSKIQATNLTETFKHTAYSAIFVLGILLIFLAYYRSVLSNPALSEEKNKYKT